MKSQKIAGKKLSDGLCLHRDNVQFLALEEETNKDIKIRDERFFENVEALETLLFEKAFEEGGYMGNWYVS